MVGGAIIGLIVGLIVVGVFYYMASQKKPSFDLPVSRSEDFNANLDPAGAIGRVNEAAQTMGLSVALEDKANHRVILDEPTSLKGYGNFIAVSAAPDGKGSKITVALMNKAPQWGPVVTKRHRAFATQIKTALGVATA